MTCAAPPIGVNSRDSLCFSGEYLGAAAVLRTWFVDPDTAMSPNLKYGGYVPGVNGGLGKPSGIIVTTCRRTTKVTGSAALLAGSASRTHHSTGTSRTRMPCSTR